MSIIRAGTCCKYCSTSRGMKKRDNRLYCLNALSEAKGEAIDKYDLEIIDHDGLNEILEIIQNLEFACFSCDGKNTVLSIVKEIIEIEQAERKKIVEKIGSLIKVDFSAARKKIARMG